MSGQMPSDVAQQALDAIGNETELGSIEDGSRESRVLLRAYGQCLRQLLRGANWDFARKTAPLTLLADSSGNTQGVGTIVPIPWQYEYAYPSDAVKARFVPWNYPASNPPIPPGNIVPPNSNQPPVSGLGSNPYLGQRLRPAPFVITTDSNYPPPAGTDTDQVSGVSQATRTVVLTNVQYAQMVYTALMIYPNNWDALFRAALVAYLASEVALALTKDKKLGLELRAQQIALAKAKIQEARVRDGNEGWFSSDIKVDWMQARYTGGRNAWGDGCGGWGPNIAGPPWDSCGFADGSAY